MPPPRRKQAAKGPDGKNKHSKPMSKRRQKADEPEEEEDLFSRNKQRYDHVESYEYQMPDDFEDEEIDEEAAFTEEDKKKYAAWFDKDEEEDADEEGEELADDEGDEGEDELDLMESEDDAGEEEEAGAAEQDEDEEEEGEEEMAEDEEEEEGAGEDDDDDGFLNDLLGDDDDDDDDDEAMEDEAGGEEDEEDAAPTPAPLKPLKPGSRAQRVISEAYPESEFALNPGAASSRGSHGARGGSSGGELTVGDLMMGLPSSDRKKLTPASRKILEKLSHEPSPAEIPSSAASKASRKRKAAGDDKEGKSKDAAGTKRPKPLSSASKGGLVTAPIAAPLPRVIKERQERKAGYEDTKEEVTKWQSIVKANREAPTVVFTTAKGDVARVNSTRAIVANHTPQSEMEAEVAALLEAAGAASSKAVEEAEEKLAMKKMTIEEVRARQDRLAKMRSVLFYHELKAKRIKAIKSKEYRKRVKGKDGGRKREGGEEEEDGDMGLDANGLTMDMGDDAAVRREREAEAEYERARERLTLRHRNTSKWARRALKRGVEVMDAGTKEALEEQLRIGQALKRKIQSAGGASRGQEKEDEHDSTDASDDDDDDEEEEEEGKRGATGSKKAKLKVLEILSGEAPEDALPKKGLFSLPFMSRSLHRQRIEAQQQAKDLLITMEGQEEEEYEEEEEGQEEGGKRGAKGAASSSSGHGGRVRVGGGGQSAKPSSVTGFDDVDDPSSLQQRNEDEDDDDVDKGEERRRRDQDRLNSNSKPTRFSLKPPSAEELRDLEAALLGSGATSVSARDINLPPSSSKAGLKPKSRASGGEDLRDVSQLNQPASSSAAVAQPMAGTTSFIPSAKFQGTKAGFVFKKGSQGLGYYLDTHLQGSAAAAKGSKGASHASASAQPLVAVVAGGPYVPPQALSAGQKHMLQRKGLGEGAEPFAADAPRTRADEDDEDDNDEETEEGGMRGGRGEGMKLAPTNKAQAMKDLVSMAFAGDDVEAEFAAEKAKDIDGEAPKADEGVPSTLPGWGMWAGSQREPRWMKEARDKASKEREEAIRSRKDAKVKNVVISEKWDKKAAKYHVASVPFPFESKEIYERSIRQPLGREFNPDVSFKNLTRPAVIKATGAVIKPARFTGASAARESAQGHTRSYDKGVVTVAGGKSLAAKQGAGGGHQGQLSGAGEKQGKK